MSGGLGVNIREETTYKVKIITRIAGGIILLCMFIGNMSHEVSAQTLCAMMKKGWWWKRWIPPDMTGRR